MYNDTITKDESIQVRELSKGNLIVFYILFMEYPLYQYITELVNQLQDRRKEIFRTKYTDYEFINHLPMEQSFTCKNRKALKPPSCIYC
jgi:hypothetical protein